MDESLSLYQASRLVFGYRRNRSLRDTLVWTDFLVNPDMDTSTWLSIPLKPGCYKCPGCVTCRCMLTGVDFPHPHTGKRYKIHHRLTCTSSFAIYIIVCPCGLYYVGKTITTLRELIGNHRSAISKALKPTQPVPRLFLKMGHTLPSFCCMAIDFQPPLDRGGDRNLALLQRES
ncbi:hypothetical protein XENTR_v10018562 [Xenopus tropicalis]|nr:hypothetical protein XENTR_v10018562 [Xenopus tropicalis]